MNTESSVMQPGSVAGMATKTLSGSKYFSWPWSASSHFGDFSVTTFLPNVFKAIDRIEQEEAVA